MKQNFENNNLNQAIIKTIAFFDLFDRALSAEELRRYCGEKCGLDELKCVAQHLEDGILAPQLLALRCGKTMEPAKAVQHLKDDVAESSGLRGGTGTLYCLRSRREEIIMQKKQADALAERKHKIAMRAAKILRFINGVKMIAVCNNFSYSEESDIDLFIITERGRLWLPRFLITLAMQLFGLRRHGKKHVKDRICLSFYISEEKMNIKSIALSFCALTPQSRNTAGTIEPVEVLSACEAADQKPALTDPYLNYWLALLKPVYGYDCYKGFYKVNSWLKDYLPNAEPWEQEECDLISDMFASVFIKKINSWWFEGKIGDLLEMVVKKLQLKKMARNLHSVACENDTRVVISNTMLKFHEKDRRVEYRERWMERMNEVISNK